MPTLCLTFVFLLLLLAYVFEEDNNAKGVRVPPTTISFLLVYSNPLEEKFIGEFSSIVSGDCIDLPDGEEWCCFRLVFFE